MQYSVRELTIGEVFDETIKLLQNHYKLFLQIALYLLIPYAVLQGLVEWIFMPSPEEMKAFDNNPAAAMGGLGSILAGGLLSLFLSIIFLLVVYPITNAAMIYAIASEYLDRPITAKEAFGRAVAKLGDVLVTMAISGVLTLLGFFALIIPGIYLSIRFFFVMHAVMVEENSGGGALTRSGELMEGNYLNLLTIGLISWVAAAIVAGLVKVVAFSILVVPLNAAVQVLFSIFGCVLSVVFYFSCRCKHEDFDLSTLEGAVQTEGAIDSSPETPSDQAQPL